MYIGWEPCIKCYLGIIFSNCLQPKLSDTELTISVEYANLLLQLSYSCFKLTHILMICRNHVYTNLLCVQTSLMLLTILKLIFSTWRVPAY